MTHRERVLKTFRFEQPDRVAHDMMEGSLWGELREHFQRAHGLDDDEKILDFLDTDCRWKWAEYQPPPADPPPEEHPPADEPPPESQVRAADDGGAGIDEDPAPRSRPREGCAGAPTPVASWVLALMALACLRVGCQR